MRRATEVSRGEWILVGNVQELRDNKVYSQGFLTCGGAEMPKEELSC